MVDNKLDNEEYEFVDPDVISPDALGGDTPPTSTASEAARSSGGQSNVRRKALIVIILVVLAMVVYKLSGFFTKKTPPKPVPEVVETPKTVIEPVPAVAQTPTPSQETPTPTATEVAVTESSLIKQKITEMDLSQQDLRDEVTRLSNQLNSINSNINDLDSKMANISQMLNNVTASLEQQAKQLARLQMCQVMHKKPPVVVFHEPRKPRPIYFIQAIIPGRAWLIATNGATLTVREGTKIPGYGTVLLIDAVQGRVRMSDGFVFTFSQDDS